MFYVFEKNERGCIAYGEKLALFIAINVTFYLLRLQKENCLKRLMLLNLWTRRP